MGSESKLQKLVKHLIDAQYQGKILALPKQFDAWIEGGKIIPASKKINGNGLIAARFSYSGVIGINPCAAPVELICAFASFYLQENASEYDSTEVEFSSDINDDNSCDVELTIEKFEEDIELIENPSGVFVLDGKRYDFGKQSLWIAETFSLTTEITSR
jgi:hypothetical protein